LNLPLPSSHSIISSARASKVGGEKRDELAAFHVDFTLPLVASPASTCHPASLIFTCASSIICSALD